MSRRLVIANQKGGIGKSTAALNIGRALTEKGYRVLLIDLDPQGGLSAAAGVDSYYLKRSVYGLLMQDNVPLGRVIQTIGDNFALVPASIDLASAEVRLSTQTSPVSRLRQALERDRAEFDYVLIDTPPTLGILTANGLTAAQELLVPVQCQFLGMRSVRAILSTMKRIQKGPNPALRLTGLFATMYRPEQEHAREALVEMQETFGRFMFQTVLAVADEMAEAPVVGKSILDYSPRHPAAYAYRALAQEIINRGNVKR